MEKFSRRVIDTKLSFKKRIGQICEKATEKLKTLARIVPFDENQNRKVLMKPLPNK